MASELASGSCKPSQDIGRIPEFNLATVLAGTGAYLLSTWTLTAEGWAAIPLR